MDGKVSKPRHAQPSVSKNFSHAQLAAASLDGGGNGGAVAQSENSVHILAAKRLHHGVRGHLRIFEMHCNSAVAPGIFELMAAVRDVFELAAQFECRFFKTSRLVSELPGEEQQSFGWRCHLVGVSAPDYTKPSAVASTFFSCAFTPPIETS